MSQTGEFRLCSGCGDRAIWIPQPQKGPVYCCQACVRGRGCDCAECPDEWAPAAESRREPSRFAWKWYA